jgi:TPP-dependent pyruvate/acetoin dehydrogenase alpha subunit
MFTEEELNEIDLSVKSEIDEAVEVAKESPYPQVEDAQCWVYVDTHDNKVFT